MATSIDQPHLNGGYPFVGARLLHGDCRELLPTLPSDSVELIITSPPYADSRANTYGGVAPDDYVAWFMPIAGELHRVLKPTGTFILRGCLKFSEESHTL